MTSWYIPGMKNKGLGPELDATTGTSTADSVRPSGGHGVTSSHDH